MKKVNRALANLPTDWRVLAGVGIAHCVLIALLLCFRVEKPDTQRPGGVKVTLATFPGKPTPPRVPSQPEDRSRQPPTPTATDTNRKVTPKKPEWKPRSADDIRRELENHHQEQPDVSPHGRTPSANNDLQRMVDDFARTTHATSIIGEPVAIPEEYSAKIQQILYDTWNQPTKTEVPNASQFVGIRLEIQADGRVSTGNITQRSKSLVMNQSVKSLLNTLKRLPPLPDSYTEKELRLDIVLKLQ